MDSSFRPAAELLGAWYVLFSSRASLRTRTHPRIELERLDAGQLQVSLYFRSHDLLGRQKTRVARSIATPEQHAGCFVVHGRGLAWAKRQRLCFPLVEPQARWMVACYERSSFGDPAGLDICTRDPSITQARLDEILAALRAHPFSSERLAGLFATEQDWFPPTPYRL